MTTEQVIAQLVQRVNAMEKELLFLRRIKTFKLGLKDLSINMSSQGLWLGIESFDDAITPPFPVTSIDIQGNLRPKGGISGSFAADGGSPVVGVTNGIITSIA
jgi:hypothetical protein